jgi:methionine aminotransferase
LLDFSGITDESDISFAFRLLYEYKLATIPVSEFYHKKINTGFIRVCFAKNNEILEKTAETFLKIR